MTSEIIIKMQDILRGIDSRKYIEDALTLTDKEKQLAREFNRWLPENITDCHMHCGLPEHVFNIDDQMYNQMISTFQGFSLEESHRTEEIFFQGKKLQRLRFAFPFRGIDVKKTNEYLLENVKAPDKIALCGDPNDIEYTNSMLKTGQFNGLKMYHQQFNPPSKSIYQYFPPKILEVAEEMNVPLILHLPKMITDCKDELHEVVKTFPKLRISLAHLGLPHLVIPNLQETYEEFSEFGNISMDTAMVPSKDVLKMAIKSFGSKRIMFGSDEPINLVRSVVYKNPNLGQRIVTEYPYHWVNKEEHDQYKHLAVGATHMHWPALQAIKDVVEELHPDNIDEQNLIKNDIFNDNAKRFFNF